MQTPVNPFKQALARGEVQLGLWQALAVVPVSTALPSSLKIGELYSS